jgi:uncharacterized protein YkwD
MWLALDGHAYGVVKTPGQERVALAYQINHVRSTHGLRPLRFGYRLTASARAHSEFMAATQDFTHGNWIERLRSFHVRWPHLGECLAKLRATPAGIVAAWMASSEHRAILLGSFTHAGVSVVQRDGWSWVTLDLGGP